jgi:hypothetical protein
MLKTPGGNSDHLWQKLEKNGRPSGLMRPVSFSLQIRKTQGATFAHLCETPKKRASFLLALPSDGHRELNSGPMPARPTLAIPIWASDCGGR